MANAYLLTNDGSGEDGDEWLLHSIHATREGAEAAKTEWYKSVEEWEIEGSLLTDAERKAIEEAADTSDVAAEFYSGKDHARADAAAKHAATLRGLLDRIGPTGSV